MTRALLDASQLHFITENITQHLRNLSQLLSWDAFNKYAVWLLHSYEFTTHRIFASQLNAVIIPSITSSQPNRRLDISTWNIPSNINLANDNFIIPESIDVLIGAPLFFNFFSLVSFN